MWGKFARSESRPAAAVGAVFLALALGLVGCGGETFQRGYVLPDGALEQIPLGASQEQVLLITFRRRPTARLRSCKPR
jgi:outer membrane protein assembly factor BamE (lipoprotein component of BamABCDE complex)